MDDRFTRRRRFSHLPLLLLGVPLLVGCEEGHPAGPAEPTAVASSVDVQASAEIVESGEFALFIPANVNHVRGVLVTLGGPNTKGFALGTPFGAPIPALEASLQELGAMYRDLAAERSLAILGFSRFGPTAFPNDPTSDQAVLDALSQAASLTGRDELRDAPLLVYAISGGAAEAVGFTQRNANRVSALFLKVPFGIESLLAGPVVDVPTYLVLAEFDVFVDNAALLAPFAAGRAGGAPWAMALERGVPHFSLSPAQRDLTVNWMRAILPFQAGGPLPTHAGWLGDPATGEIAPWQTFAGDRNAASWFPTRPLAGEWAAFIAP